MLPLAWIARLVMRLMERGDKGISSGLRSFAAWRWRKCPLCKSRKLSPVRAELWTGIPGSMKCTTYRCRGCGEELFAEHQGALMTMAEQAAWQDAKEMRVLAPAELPKATARLVNSQPPLDK